MNVVIIGCGVVGAAIAYELSQVKDLKVTVFDKQPPSSYLSQTSTKAALGVLMGVISQKIKGKAWRLRQTSIERYEAWIPELEALTNQTIPFNRQGILSLCFEGEDLTEWQKLAEIRHSQGFPLEIWDTAKLQKTCPQIRNEKIIGAVYSPRDRQVDPTALTLALVDAARHYGVEFKFGVDVLPLACQRGDDEHFCSEVETTQGKITGDWFVVSAGLGSNLLTSQLKQIVDVRPVLGQALQVSLENSLGNPDFQPAITGNDVHIVPVGSRDYWVGATVEFPINTQEIQPNQEMLDSVKQQAISFCPDLAKATTIRSWSGLRPRPEGRPAPIIEKLQGFSNVLLATGHYRNGVLLAPATAVAIHEMIISNDSKRQTTTALRN
ncbi:FAD-binding oxidoreductase [Aetokthonos hydrillicola Thurmond2011]|jgi:glycine/D-amino acid oxidase-like deaminating enzyme|uniref:FAD-binding oxidoreductase n=1 Tax=Aetokthonos hydrillicola Thurmond2011 TaxID=2712845 RepID=A0AAP5I292_9CYAN|nr:FAD-dependent oxidoreductase [Aetokthonos hydrillicola]MBO3462685.1 FAD-binding oxidoreductase [Aetokthonos hydrillicola CCALA 1050]MBW4588056.1 FAD-binding oxidoreductase [Aetokthonos hydrillicola CCALA 1050]MDR9893371.1 FAD-binding oxidoreductase [Aetokthonos hydrillicola Thurmond2011]